MERTRILRRDPAGMDVAVLSPPCPTSILIIRFARLLFKDPVFAYSDSLAVMIRCQASSGLFLVPKVSSITELNRSYLHTKTPMSW